MKLILKKDEILSSFYNKEQRTDLENQIITKCIFEMEIENL